jgi:carboxymethylenebutenolidase
MTESAIDTSCITISQVQKIDGLASKAELPIAAYLAYPKKPGIYPGIVVLQEIFGVNAHIRSCTERIAREGYVAIAPSLFERSAPGYESGYTSEDIEIGRQYAWGQTKASELLSDIQAAINHLKTLPNVKKEGFGCIGFCFGGHVAYLAATLPDIKATASFYGARITTTTPGGSDTTLSRTSEIKGKLYAFFGMEDASIPSDQIDQIEASLEKYRISSRVFRYDGADHGFFCDHRKSYNPVAANDAWGKVKQLFAQQLS